MPKAQSQLDTAITPQPDSVVAESAATQATLNSSNVAAVADSQTNRTRGELFNSAANLNTPLSGALSRNRSVAVENQVGHEQNTLEELKVTGRQASRNKVAQEQAQQRDSEIRTQNIIEDREQSERDQSTDEVTEAERKLKTETTGGNSPQIEKFLEQVAERAELRARAEAVGDEKALAQLDEQWKEMESKLAQRSDGLLAKVVAADTQGYTSKAAELQGEKDQKTIRAIEQFATNTAKYDFDRGEEISEQSLDRLQKVIEANPHLAQQIVNTFESNYESSHSAQVSESGWISRQYNSVTSAVSSVGSKVGNMASEVAGGVTAVAGAAVSVAAATANVVLNPIDSTVAAVTAVGNGIVTGASAIKNGVVAAASTTATLATGAFTLAADVGDLMADADWKAIRATVKDKLTDPEFYEAIGSGLEKARQYAINKTAEGLVAVYNDPVAALKGGGTALKAISDEVGLTAAVNGVVAVVGAPTEAVMVLIETGSFRAAGQSLIENAKEGVDGVIGAVLVAGELTGVTDLVMTCKYGTQAVLAYGRGDKLEAAMLGAQAAMHGVFAVAAAGSIIATVGTGGAAAGSMLAVASGKTAVRTALSQTVKHALGGFGRELGDQALKAAAEQIGEVALRQGMQGVGEKAAVETVSQLAEIGARGLTDKVVQSTTRETTARVTREFIENSGIGKALTEQSEALTKRLLSGNKRVVSELRDSGMSKAQAKTTAGELKTLLKKGATDDEIAKHLADEAAKPISEAIIKESQETFATTFSREMTQEFGAETAEKYAKAAMKGFKEGVQKGVKEAAETAILRGVKLARLVKLSKSFGTGEGQKNENELEERLTVAENAEEVKLAREKAKLNVGENKKVEHLNKRQIVRNGERLLVADMSDGGGEIVLENLGKISNSDWNK